MKAFLTIGIVAVLLSYPVEANASLPEPIVRPGEIAAQPGGLPVPEGLDLDEDSYPVTDGSTSAEPLGVWVAARLLGLHPAWLTLPLENERRLWPVENGEREGERDNVTLVRSTLSLYGQKLRHRGTHTAYRRLIEGQADLIYECRLPSPDEIKLMEEHGIELDVTPIALDAFVFLRHKDNPVAELTAEQVRDIYTRAEDGDRGRIDNWEQVDGPDAAIHAYTRNPNSGSQETLLTLVMKDREVIAGRGIMETFGMMGPFNRLYDDPQGVGFTFYYYQVYMAPLTTIDPRAPGDTEPESPVEMFAVDGVMPSRETIADGSYPWVTKVYAVTRKDLDPEHPAARLRDWLLTEEGQSVIAETGYVPLREE